VALNRRIVRWSVLLPAMMVIPCKNPQFARAALVQHVSESRYLNLVRSGHQRTRLTCSRVMKGEVWVCTKLK
jgi:hypothetical protein